MIMRPFFASRNWPFSANFWPKMHCGHANSPPIRHQWPAIGGRNDAISRCEGSAKNQANGLNSWLVRPASIEPDSAGAPIKAAHTRRLALGRAVVAMQMGRHHYIDCIAGSTTLQPIIFCLNLRFARFCPADENIDNNLLGTEYQPDILSAGQYLARRYSCDMSFRYGIPPFANPSEPFNYCYSIPIRSDSLEPPGTNRGT